MKKCGVFPGAILLPLLSILLLKPAMASVVYSNDFETNTDGFAASGTLSGLDRVSLATDSNGPSSSQFSTWLGKIGFGVAKTGAANETVTLNLSNLVPDSSYSVAFDLLIGGSWDGAASFYGPDSWRFSVDGNSLVDTIFSNGQQGVDFGAYSPQRYTDTSYSSPNGPDVAQFSGADQSFSTHDGNYSVYYGIYYFGHGAGNPMLNFTATGSTATLTFERYGNSPDSPDEYWALDNVRVASASTVAPEPGSIALMVTGFVALLGQGRRRGRA